MNKKKLIFTLFYFLLGGVLTANASITIYVNSSSSSYYMYAWDTSNSDLTDSWPGTQFSSMSTTTVDGVTYYYMTFDADELNVIFCTGAPSSSNNYQQTGDITGITEDMYFNYCGGTTYTTVSSSSTTTSFTIYVNSSSSDYYLYAWSGSDYFTGTWPGVRFSSMGTTTVNGTTYYYYTFYGFSSVSLIFNNGSSGTGNQTETITVTEDTYFTYSGGDTYETVDISSTSSSDGTTYYLVADAGAKCKFTPDRTRSGGSLNYSYQNLHLQDFIIQADGDDNTFLTEGYLQFHIEDAAGTKYYLTGSNTLLEDLSYTYSIPTDESNAFNGPISTDTYFDDSYNGDAAALYWVPLSSSQTTATDFKIKAGVGKSYTFLWQPSNSGLYLIVNGEEFGDASSYYTDGTRTSVANYYLIGNFTGASATTDIDPYYSDNRKMLTPYYYSGGDEYGGTMESCDSIVYEIEVARPSAGWSELYLDLVNEEDFNTYSSSSWYSNENAWAKVIRPEATWSSSGAAYALDATALTGGLMRNENASYQSLNPVVSDDIDSYVFTMNVSTSTYSIRFVSAASNTTTDDGSTDGDEEEEEETEETSSYLYIFGTAVGSDGSTTSDNWEGANAFKLTYSSSGGYYYYAGSDGEEAAIPMTAAGEFAFVTDMDFSKGYYTEDGNRPPTLIEETTEDGTTTYTSTETTAYSANTGGGFYETQYVNMLGTNHTASNAAYDSESIRTITWGLLSGDYYIRFYVGATIGEYAKNLYTVRRSYTLLRPDADAVTVDNNTGYTTFKVFCDYNAVVVPSDVDVLYVPEISEALTENTDDESSDYTTYDLELKVLDFGDNARVLPANTPVILAMTTERSSSNSDDSDDTGDLESSTITMDYYSDPTSTLNSTTTAMTPSIPYEAAPEKTADDGESYNFFFGYRRLSDSDNKPTIGFYLPISGGYSAINGAYLNIKSEYISSSSDDESSAKEAALVFYSDLTDIDETDGSETTGISNALAADDADADGAYYTLQGMRIAKPTVKGIYIHNGKKTVVR